MRQVSRTKPKWVRGAGGGCAWSRARTYTPGAVVKCPNGGVHVDLVAEGVGERGPLGYRRGDSRLEKVHGTGVGRVRGNLRRRVGLGGAGRSVGSQLVVVVANCCEKGLVTGIIQTPRWNPFLALAACCAKPRTAGGEAKDPSWIGRILPKSIAAEGQRTARSGMDPPG